MYFQGTALISLVHVTAGVEPKNWTIEFDSVRASVLLGCFRRKRLLGLAE